MAMRQQQLESNSNKHSPKTTPIQSSVYLDLTHILSLISKLKVWIDLFDRILCEN
jgi:hypothetical protein